MKDDSTKAMSNVIRIDDGEIRGHLTEIVRGTVEETLNAMLDAEADELCNAQRYEHSPDRVIWIRFQNWRSPPEGTGPPGDYPSCRPAAPWH